MFVIGLRTKNIGPIEMKVCKLLAGIIMPIINLGLLPFVFFHLQSIFLQDGSRLYNVIATKS